MYCRIINIELAPGTSHDDVIAYMESVRSQYDGTGLSMTIYETSPTSGFNVVVYDSPETAEAAADRVGKVLEGLAPLIAGPPQILEGASYWELGQ